MANSAFHVKNFKYKFKTQLHTLVKPPYLIYKTSRFSEIHHKNWPGVPLNTFLQFILFAGYTAAPSIAKCHYIGILFIPTLRLQLRGKPGKLSRKEKDEIKRNSSEHFRDFPIQFQQISERHSASAAPFLGFPTDNAKFRPVLVEPKFLLPLFHCLHWH